MAKYKISIDLDGCIGAISCIAVADKLWELGKDMKAHPKVGEVRREGNTEFIIISDEELKKLGIDLDDMNQSAAVCPTQAIKVEKIEE